MKPLGFKAKAVHLGTDQSCATVRRQQLLPWLFKFILILPSYLTKNRKTFYSDCTAVLKTVQLSAEMSR